MVTWLRLLNNGRSFSSALMARRFLASCNPFRLIYAQSLLITCVRGIGLLPMTAASFALGCKGLMNAGFGARFLPEEDFFLVVFFSPAVFFLVAIARLPIE